MIFQIDVNASKRGLKKMRTDYIAYRENSFAWSVGLERFSSSDFAVNYLAKALGISVVGLPKYAYTLAQVKTDMYEVVFYMAEDEKECDIEIITTDVDLFPSIRPLALAGSPSTET